MGLFTQGVLLASLFAVSPQLDPEGLQVGSDGIPIPTKSMHIDFSQETNIADLVDAYCDATGVQVFASHGSQQSAQMQKLGGFGKAKSLAPDEIQTYFEATLAANGFRLCLLNTSGTVAFSLESFSSMDSYSNLQFHTVDASDLPQWLDNSSILIESTVTLEYTDPRQLSTNLRPLFAQPGFNGIMNMGNSDSLLLRGTGSQVASASRMLLKIDGDAEGLSSYEASQLFLREKAAKEAALAAQATTASAVADDSPGAADPIAVTPLADRPHLLTTIVEISSDLNQVTRLLEDLSGNRHKAENAHRIWFTADDGEQVLWPKPNLTYLEGSNRGPLGTGGRLIIQGAEDDVKWITKCIKLVIEPENDSK